jgi:uncharacterized protein (TIGR00725 family)
MAKRCISVIGSSAATEEEFRNALEVGREIAKRGAVLVCGGLTGVMEAAAKGAKEAGGLTVGVIPGESPSSANPYIDVIIPTGFGVARNVLVVASGDAVIAIGGKLGTLSEIAVAFLKGKPVIGLGTWELERERAEGNEVIIVESAKEAVERAFKVIEGRPV